MAKNIRGIMVDTKSKYCWRRSSVGIVILLWLIPLHTAFSMPEMLIGTLPEGNIAGRVTAASSGDGIDQVYLVVDGTNHFVATDENGRYRLPNIPAKQYTLKVYRLGYTETAREIRVIPDSTIRIDFMLRKDIFTGTGITVEGKRISSPKSRAVDMQMSGKKLQENLGNTIAETIDEEPGIAQRTMGPAPARPILRGLSGDRVKVLEDGGETGDLSATSADHAVAIEPITTERIEVIRGPATLMYTSNALGGVVNVVRNVIAREAREQVRGTSQVQGESVNSGYSGGGNLVIPFGSINVFVDGSYRSSGDMNTPEGRLTNTAIQTVNASSGLSWIYDSGFLGISGRYYDSEYGIPGGFVGAHPGGVDVELLRHRFDVKGQYNFSSARLKKLEWQGGYTRYHHREYEANGIVGVEYGLVTSDLKGTLTLRNFGQFQNGHIGFWSESRNYAAGGFAFTPQTIENSYAVFGYQEMDLSSLLVKSSFRFGYRDVSPEAEKISNRIGHIRRRHFTDVAGALTGEYRLSTSIRTGLTFMRSYRAPLLEELFSEGPHLAAYAFEVGNPDLDSEIGLGGEIFLAYDADFWHWKTSMFQNSFRGYIFPVNTGDMNYRTLLPIYQYTGADAVFRGIEAETHGNLAQHWTGRFSFSYVRATLTDSKKPLPYIPPLSGKMSLVYNREQLSIGNTIRGATHQKRVAEFEEPTDGYAVMDINAQYMIPRDRYIHSIALSISNVFSTTYRKHLSRVKVIMPEPGRNFKLNYRVYF